jgi:cytidylate kinase
MKVKNIAIAGGIGTGKSTLARNIASKLGWQYVSSGEYFREWHEKQHIPLEESEKVPEEMDIHFDNEIKHRMQEEDNVVFEAHLAQTFKVLCTATDEEAFKRAAIRDGISLEEELEKAKQRRQSHIEKFKRLYGVDDHLSKEYFDLVVDTTTLSKEEVLEEVLRALKKHDGTKH